LDLSRTGRLSTEHSRLITTLEPSVRASYNAYIGQLAAVNDLRGVEWLCRASCRNTLACLIYRRFCRLSLLDALLAGGDVPEQILVGSASMRTATLSVLQKHSCTTPVQVTSGERKTSVFRNLAQSLHMLANLFVWPKLTGRRKDFNSVKASFIYLDTFVSPDSFDDRGNHRDRYYPGLLEDVDDDTRARVLQVPSFFGARGWRDYARLFRKLRRSRVNFLLREDYLHVGDYLGALLDSHAIPGAIKTVPAWNGIDVAAIVLDEVRRDRFSSDLVNALLLYRFMGRLRAHGFRPDLVLDWNENQVVDRALCLAVRDVFPGARIKGYQSFVVPNSYACIQPTEYEKQAGTLPDELCVIGKAYVEDRLAFCPSMKTSLAPAYRFLYLLDSPAGRDRSNRFEILVALPMDVSEAKEIVNVVLAAAAGFGEKSSVKMKLHPTHGRDFFRRYSNALERAAIVVVDEPTSALLGRADLLISATSSMCFEAVMLGVPVAIVSDRRGPVGNPVPLGLGPDTHAVCYDEKDLQEFIERARNNGRFERTSRVERNFRIEHYVCSTASASLL